MDDSDPHRPARPSPRGTASYPRKRAVKACQVCRARRTKCDNLKPSCSFCLKVGATCIQSPEDLSSFDPASLKILERLDSLEQLMRSSLSHSAGPAEDGDGDQHVDMDMVLPPSSRHVLTNAQSQSQHTPASSSAQVLAPGLLGGAHEEPRQIKTLLDNFFNYAHVKNPILDEAGTRRMVLSQALDGLGLDWSPDSCLALLVCALGSISTPFGPSPETMPGTPTYAHAQAYFQAAQKRLGLLMASDDIVAPQCFFLAGVFMMCTFQPVRAWRLFVQAVVACQQFEFLADWSGCGFEGRGGDHSLQQAVYWSAWKSERELRGDVHRPDFAVSEHDQDRLYPSFFPTPPAPNMALYATNDAMTDQNQTREQTSWYFYLSEISLRRLAARITAETMTMKETHTSRQALLHHMAAVLPSYEAQVAEWQASLPPSLSFDNPAEDDDVCRFVLRGHLVNVYEMIYWPFLSCFVDSGKSDNNSAGGLLSLRCKFAKQAQRGLDNHMYRLLVNKAGYRHRHHGTDPLMRSCSRSALVLLALARGNRAQNHSGIALSTLLRLPDSWHGEIAGVIELLGFWSPETSEYDGIRRLLHCGLAAEEACSM
ncbi:hypothetical protein Micbo1qcDRAFT_151535 [Microdochium bolleyi]|uniref:Zn(2)-C6 fungal-type domain-containing protein n=1 Tax=Microdochium bolleyi TaxID=196109 RepID=A0A136ISN8_9PEZI|nr:hypothetical protein Micbo1qcDRAFT_151535 [Microdochium bolleyi]